MTLTFLNVLIKDFFVVLVNKQLEAQFFFLIYLFQFFTCFEHLCAHHQGNQWY